MHSREAAGEKSFQNDREQVSADGPKQSFEIEQREMKKVIRLLLQYIIHRIPFPLHNLP
jgi:hypothetical protein